MVELSISVCTGVIHYVCFRFRFRRSGCWRGFPCCSFYSLGNRSLEPVTGVLNSSCKECKWYLAVQIKALIYLKEKKKVCTAALGRWRWVSLLPLEDLPRWLVLKVCAELSRSICSLGPVKALVLNLGCTRITWGAAQNTDTYRHFQRFQFTCDLTIRISRRFQVVPTCS